MPEPILHRISKMVMKETVEDKKVELMQSGTNILVKDIDILDLIDTLELYELINDSIDKYNNHTTVQIFLKDMVGNTKMFLLWLTVVTKRPIRNKMKSMT